jgi:N-carbamoyl-D-amino-acid hydrolase
MAMPTDSTQLTCAVVQLPGLDARDGREVAVARMIDGLREASDRGARFVAFPELCLTTFFPRTWFENLSEVDRYFEPEMPNRAVAPLFDAAAAAGVAFTFGFAELASSPNGPQRFNTSVMVAPNGRIVGRYRKIHLPGHADNRSHLPFQHLEKRYFSVGDTGFQVTDLGGVKTGLCICNDRRWPETYRVLALRGAELVAVGYNTPTPNTDYDEPDHLNMFHHRLSVQAGAYQNGLWVLAAAKAGVEDGIRLMGGSCIVAPTGEIVASAASEAPQVLVYNCDLGLGRSIREHIFNFAAHRRPEHYGPITAPVEK